MCGRIVQSDVVEKVGIFLEVQEGSESDFSDALSYNISPGSRIIAIQLNEHQDKVWTTFRWGMLPDWASRKRPVINARSETVTRKPMFRNAFQTCRGIIPVTAYYEWRAGFDGKQPYCIRNKDGFPLLLAGIYTEDECVILTRSAQRNILFIHDRMPVMIRPDMIDTYLNQPDEAYELIGYERIWNLEAYPVTKKVGHTKFNHPICLEPVDCA